MRFIPRLRRGVTSVVTGSLLAATLVAAPTAAHASTTGCVYDPQYGFSGVYTTHITDRIGWGTANETITTTLESGDTVTGTIGGSVETDVSLFFASAKVSVNASISKSFTSSVTMSGSWTVPSTYKGEAWFADGADSDHMNWRYYAYNGACQYEQLSSGTANLPYRFPVWYHS